MKQRQFSVQELGFIPFNRWHNQQGETGDGGQKEVDQILLKAATSTLWTWNSSEMKYNELSGCFQNVSLVGAPNQPLPFFMHPHGGSIVCQQYS